MWPIAVQASLVPGESFEEKCALIASWGAEGIEVSGRDLLEHADALARATANEPVRVTSACAGFTGWLVDRNPRSRNLAIAEIKEMLAIGAELKTAGLVAPAAYGLESRYGVLPPHRSAYTLEEDRELLVDALLQVTDAAKRSGGTLLLEPLNRYVDRVINTLAEAAELMARVGSPHLKLVPDLFHMNIEEADPYESLRAHAPLLGHLHLSDSNRLLPGRGHIDFAQVFRVLREVGYDRALAIECRITDDPKESLPQALGFLKRLMA